MMVAAAGIACGDGGNEPEDADIPFTEYSFDTDIRLYHDIFKEEQGNALLTLNSDEEMRVYFGSNYTPVDFSKKSVLLAYGLMTSGFSSAKIDSFSRKSDGTHALGVSVWRREIGIMDHWIAAIVTDRIEADSEFEIDVKYPAWQLEE